MKVSNAVAAAAAILALPLVAFATPQGNESGPQYQRGLNVQVGPRPYFLVDDMDASPLKSKLQSCSEGPFKRTDFSIGHRGAPLQFPEHTKESYEAAARMGAGILECDVTFTKDKELVCRHSQCDLHTTTNILATPLAAKCSVPFTPAVIDPVSGALLQPATAQCCTSDITVDEFKTLRGKMDAFNPRAKTAEEYLGGTANWRTDLYAGPSSGTLLTHKESIELFKSLGAKMTPELKSPSVQMPFDGLTQEGYAQKMIDEYKSARVPARKVWPQSFDYADIMYWIRSEPAFGKQAVFLDDAESPADLPGFAELQGYANDGVKIVAPPLWALVALDGDGKIVPSEYANNAKAAGLDIITWTLERSGHLADGNGGWYYQTIQGALNNEGDTMETLDVLAKDVGILGIFSDWPGTVTYYANCMRLK
ncbi:MAG: glycerophosphodiester phosphodiesterase family protein [Pseudomonadota bacterium]